MKRTSITQKLIGLATLVGLLTVSGVAVAQESEPSVVTVFHAVPAEDGFPADVYLDGDLIIDGFVFESSSDSFELAAGDYDLEIFAEGADPDSDSPAVTATVTLEEGANYSMVAQLSDGAPVVSLFENDTSGVGPGEARLTFRQTSDAAGLDLSIDGEPVFSNISSTSESSTELEAGDVQLAISGESGESLFDRQVALSDGMLTVIYAVGQPGEDSFDLLVQEVLIPQVAPSGVPTGTGGIKATGIPYTGWYLLPLGMLVASFWVERRME